MLTRGHGKTKNPGTAGEKKSENPRRFLSLPAAAGIWILSNQSDGRLSKLVHGLESGEVGFVVLTAHLDQGGLLGKINVRHFQAAGIDLAHAALACNTQHSLAGVV